MGLIKSVNESQWKVEQLPFSLHQLKSTMFATVYMILAMTMPKAALQFKKHFSEKITPIM